MVWMCELEAMGDGQEHKMRGVRVCRILSTIERPGCLYTVPATLFSHISAQALACRHCHPQRGMAPRACVHLLVCGTCAEHSVDSHSRSVFGTPPQQAFNERFTESFSVVSSVAEPSHSHVPRHTIQGHNRVAGLWTVGNCVLVDKGVSSGSQTSCDRGISECFNLASCRSL